MKIRNLIVFCAMSIIASCAAMTSNQIDYSESRQAKGVQYSLPKGVFRVELYVSGEDMYLSLSEPMYIGDPKATYTLAASSGALADQKYIIGVEPGTRLLSFVQSESEGQAGNIVQAIAQSLGGVSGLRNESSAYSALDAAEDRIIYSRIIDPFQQPDCYFGQVCHFSALTQELREVSMAYFGCESGGGVGLCSALRNQDDFFAITLDPLFDPLADQADSRRKARKNNRACKSSICYRSALPYAMNVRVTGFVDESNIVLLPNVSPAIPLSIPAGVFADARVRVFLIDGMPVEVSVNRDNELVAVARTPLLAINSFFSSFSQVAQLRINYNSERGQLIQSQAALDEIRRQDAAASGEPALGGLTGSRAENSADDSFTDRPQMDASDQNGAQFGRDDVPTLFKVRLGYVASSAGTAAPPADDAGSGADLGGSEPY